FYSPDAIIEYYPGGPDSKQIIPVERGGGHGYHYEAQHVCDCLREGLTESPIMTHNDTLQLMEVLDEIRKEAGIKYKEDKAMH
ncbi:MAG: gfo/Idh/MocA family oxidoreductase, partial [Bacteroidota bacterium]|nr:gfo/Idh/MocA family oxidoreductase [Bacteroidota bacterium]